MQGAIDRLDLPGHDTNWGAGQAKLGSRLLPGVAALRGYQRSWLRGDLLAGLAVAAYLIPQVMAFAEIAGLPAVTGLVAACGALGVYAVLGSSRQLSVDPESTTALMTAAAVAPLAGGDSLRYATLAAGSCDRRRCAVSARPGGRGWGAD